MKFVTAELHGRTFIGLIYDDNYVIDIQKAEKKLYEEEFTPSSMLQCIELGDKFVHQIDTLMELVEKEKERESYVYPLADIKLLAPIPRPTKNIFCVGKNYRDHALEMGTVEDIPKHVMIFSKTPTTVIAHEEQIDPHLHVTNELDYEGELAVIIGKKGKRISIEDAMDYVFGYTIINDVTARDLQNRHKQYLLGKSLDTSCPMGPFLVHKSAIPHPHQLNIETKVNGEIRQKANTEQMIFPIPEIISVISQGTTLEPGDIIATGTPAGVGKGFNPPKLLQSGDIIEITVEGIGTLRNTVKAKS
ncbi:fumarylacetoacetate hydrolase family protein [Bacillus alveayuensis]|jgi:2-keto-4-pentenoate hydratase/2-oxohepta-3-ene-1,7-dioic acid hydratase in catechol pathway|uniref:2-keto-4-pentenoate hydratase/2-oxohepta-3-ene-1,7-dioic acid hydratase in catechol pathway n=1 Tax=Aeribacillus alveayuensis TaxID=279215 RepID=A0ABT9VN26_9BACI|nr:fumarylacetoacetate hydrolase family protein [Bacillus alveayuensis]MDQ0162385.1 2-keto-4-pentenoate hydratase/2-oxohepta-3-ene-1,7-dioic acid hydratase in catechol pathway [Bacillus alveayuensis]